MRTFAIVAAVILFAISPAFATFSYTPVYSPPSGELNHSQILKEIYGTGAGGYFWGTIAGNSYACGSMRAWRVYDDNGDDIRLDLLLGSPDDVDQIWTDGATTVTAKAKWAGDTQSFGWNEGGTGTDTYEELLTEDSLDQPGVSIDITGDFLWGYMPNGEEWWSMQSANNYGHGEEDHMVTYRMEGLPDMGEEAVWLVFLEDRPFVLYEGCHWVKESDRDYNDFVVEISAVPEPATAFLLVSGIALLLRKR